MLILKKLRCIAFDLFILSVVIFQSNLGRKWMKAFVANLNLVSCFVSHAQEMSVRQRRHYFVPTFVFRKRNLAPNDMWVKGTTNNGKDHDTTFISATQAKRFIV